ncbi:hypothetical protein BC936DRAFT_137720 [Jimgerdemannia flammicorona]|uniref:Uncharacterized protein n=1 Tax=Jimgerdemannia flammicorona TaxID=994334 RepID=A0A433DIV2_9FUNG|nr:hypothetical protein BC936DRAFT_137720 [Jimgerdemannia flammicorona]
MAIVRSPADASSGYDLATAVKSLILPLSFPFPLSLPLPLPLFLPLPLPLPLPAVEIVLLVHLRGRHVQRDRRIGKQVRQLLLLLMRRRSHHSRIVAAVAIRHWRLVRGRGRLQVRRTAVQEGLVRGWWAHQVVAAATAARVDISVLVYRWLRNELPVLGRSEFRGR